MVSSPARLLARSFSAAFTLIELLTVIAIIGILSAITFGVARGVNERAAINQARAELSAIATALETYKSAYGDYPQNVTQAQLLQALIGKRGPIGAVIDAKAVIEISRFTTSADPYSVATATLQDPWGRDYRYFYKVSGSWVNPSFVLLSVGPDNNLTVPDSSGIINNNDTAGFNIDNIYPQ